MRLCWFWCTISASLEMHRVLSSDPEQQLVAADEHACFAEVHVSLDVERNSRSYRLRLRPEFSSRTLLQLVHFLYTVSAGKEDKQLPPSSFCPLTFIFSPFPREYSIWLQKLSSRCRFCLRV